MADYTGEVLREGRAGIRGEQVVALGKFSLTAGLANNDTITFSNLIPNKDRVKVIGFKLFAPELDTNSTPTGTITVGDGTDADGYLTSKDMGVNSAQLTFFGDGALIGADAGTVAGRDVVITVASAVATATTSGDIFVEVLTEAV